MSNPYAADDILTDYAKSVIAVKAFQLCQRVDFRSVDRCDLEQELWLAVCQKAHLYQADKASFDTFVDRVVNAAVARMLRDRKRKKRLGHLHSRSLEERNQSTESATLADGISLKDVSRWTGVVVGDASAEAELDEAVASALTTMPEELRALARQLMTKSALAITRDTSMTRHALRLAIREIRAYLEAAGLEFHPSFRQLARKRDM
jgi:hypothetical protein